MFYQTKDLDLCVVIVSLNASAAEIRKTYLSMDLLNKKHPCIVVYPEDKQLDMEELNITGLPCFKGGNCITSMYDIGIENSLSEWAYLVFSGTILRKNIDLKLSKYVETEKDVLFPVVDKIWTFPEGSMNGVLINKEFHKHVGEFGSGNTLKVTKLMWAANAAYLGGKFKAIVGAFNI
jgi:hypothetical protein